MKLILTAAALALVAGCSNAAPPRENQDRIATEAQVRAHSDAFGIDNLKPTLPGGTVWTSRWGGSRRFGGVDPRDPWFDANHGSATYRVSKGKLYISGNIPRMYVHDPKMKRQWRNVEITMYFKRVADTGIPYAGMTMVARSNHLDTESGRHVCDTRGYGARLRYDGHADFEKETAFPINEAVANKELWPSLPRNRWIGMKFLVFDMSNGVHLELWRDLTDGRDGGHWGLVDRVVDNGDLFGNESCRKGIDPRMPLTSDPKRAGSESGKPNLTVYFRSDGVLKDGLVYKWGSVREITTK